MVKLTKSEVRHVAKLVDFGLSERQLRKFQKELSETLSYIEILEKVDTKGIRPTSQVTGLENITREDKATFSLPAQDALLNAPQKNNGFVKTKAVL